MTTMTSKELLALIRKLRSVNGDPLTKAEKDFLLALIVNTTVNLLKDEEDQGAPSH